LKRLSSTAGRRVCDQRHRVHQAPGRYRLPKPPQRPHRQSRSYRCQPAAPRRSEAWSAPSCRAGSTILAAPFRTPLSRGGVNLKPDRSRSIRAGSAGRGRIPTDRPTMVATLSRRDPRPRKTGENSASTGDAWRYRPQLCGRGLFTKTDFSSVYSKLGPGTKQVGDLSGATENAVAFAANVSKGAVKGSPCRPRGKTALAAVNGPSLGHAATTPKRRKRSSAKRDWITPRDPKQQCKQHRPLR
jgi:hypothetical protein